MVLDYNGRNDIGNWTCINYFTVCTEHVRSPYTEHAASGQPYSLRGGGTIWQAQDQQMVTTCSPRIVTECLLTHSSRSHLSRFMTKPTKWLCAQRRLRSAWASALWGAKAVFMRAAKNLIRLGGCPGWSESSLGVHAILLVLSWGGSFEFENFNVPDWNLHKM